jgi:LemA protein
MVLLIVFGVITLVGVVAALWAIGVYNGLVKLRNQMKNAFAQIDVQLKRRYDLIPNLVETAKAYMKHEQETLTAVIAARNQGLAAMKALSENATDPAAFKSLMQAEGSLGSLLRGLSVTMEAYPDLKANTTMNGLLEELTSTENKVSFARQAYNDAVLVYNNAREIFPASMISGAFQFTAGILFEVENAGERQAVKVQF